MLSAKFPKTSDANSKSCDNFKQEIEYFCDCQTTCTYKTQLKRM